MATRIFFTTDLHGSEKCFKKFINAGKFYEADVIVCGGDITGKMVIPIFEASGPGASYEADLMGARETARSKEELEGLMKKIHNLGFYPYVTTSEEFDKVKQDPNKIDQLFSELMIQTLQGWLEIAEERLKGTDIRCFMTPGNDDKFEIDPILAKSSVISNPEGKVVKVDDHHELISTGFTNITPWNCPRDIEEEELEQKIHAMASQLEDPKNAIFDIHVPPFDTKLDQAPKLDNLKVVSMMGNPILEPVGSISVRKAVEKYQPLLGLHGHIHESKGYDHIGRTLIINPGSEYSEGILHGAVIELDADKVRNFVLVQG
jgi:Icc-related predicted phosphoesterase